MFIGAVALILYAASAVVALVGIVLIVNGVKANRRGGGGRALVIIGIVVVLLPVGVFASSLLPGQH